MSAALHPIINTATQGTDSVLQAIAEHVDSMDLVVIKRTVAFKSFAVALAWPPGGELLEQNM